MFYKGTENLKMDLHFKISNFDFKCKTMIKNDRIGRKYIRTYIVNYSLALWNPKIHCRQDISTPCHPILGNHPHNLPTSNP